MTDDPPQIADPQVSSADFLAAMIVPRPILRGDMLYKALMHLKPEGLAETEWAIQAGVNRGFFTNLKGSNISPRSDTLQRLLGVIGKRSIDLYLPEGSEHLPMHQMPGLETPRELMPSADLSNRDLVTIQKLDLSLSMGPGTLIDDWVEAEPVAFDLAFIRAVTRSPADRLKLVTGIGDSMYPTLNWGDTILVDTTDRQLSRQDGIYWIDLYGASGIKRLRTIAPGRVLVKSDNKDIGDQEVDASDLRIQGRAIWLARGL